MIPFFPHPATRAFSITGLFLGLLCAPGICTPQQPAPTFDELAARASEARNQQDIPRAIQLYAQAEQVNPSWQEGWWYLGVLHYTANQFAEATEAFNHLLELTPRSVPALALRGLCEFETGSYDGSLRDLELAMSHGAAADPRNEQIIRFHLAQLLTRAGRFQEALDQYRYFTANRIDAPDLMVGISLAGMRTPSLAKDIPAENRGMFEAAGKAGYVYLSGDGDAADELFRALFARYPSAPNLHFFYGMLLFAKHPELAVEQFQCEIDVNPGSEEANALFAFASVIEGHFADAVGPARQAYATAPNMELAEIALGRALAETGDPGRGAELLQQVIARDPGNVEAHLGLLSIYSQSGNREELDREREICRELGS